MSRKGPTKNEYSQGFSYIAQKPKFLQNFGKPPSPPPNARGGPSNPRGDGREPLPTRPRDGEWAGGSDDERDKKGDGEESEDEWAEMYGGGDDGPQIVVLKEGRHLTSDEVKRERRRGGSCSFSSNCDEAEKGAAGKPSESPPPKTAPTSNESKAGEAEGKEAPKEKPPIPKPNINKRKLVGAAAEEYKEKETGKPGDARKKKKAKPAKGLLSFDEGDE